MVKFPQVTFPEGADLKMIMTGEPAFGGQMDQKKYGGKFVPKVGAEGEK